MGCLRRGTAQTIASALWARRPRARVACQQGRFLGLGQRKKFLCLPLERIGATRRRSTTHERRAIVIMPQPNRMAQLMRDDIARDVGQIQRIEGMALDPEHGLHLLSGLEAPGERDEITIGHRDDDVTRHVLQAVGEIQAWLSLQHGGTEPFKIRRGDLLWRMGYGPESERGADLSQLPIPQIDRIESQLDPGVLCRG